MNGNGAQMNKILLQCENVWKIYMKDGKENPVCRDLNFEVFDNEFLCIVGPTGSGKSTILKMMAGLDSPSMGAITLRGEPITKPDQERGMIFQEYSLLPWRTVLENVELGMEFSNEEKQLRREKALKYINMVGLGYAKDKYPWELSGGMKRRTTLAMILITNPKILLMDGAFNALDARTKMTMHTEIMNIWQREENTIVFVTAELDEAVKLGDRVVILNSDGGVERIIEINLPRPRHGKAVQDPGFLRRFIALKEEVLEVLKNAQLKKTVSQ